MKIMDQTAFEAQNVFGLGAPNDAYAQYFTGQSFLRSSAPPVRAGTKRPERKP